MSENDTILTSRERQCLSLLAQGATAKQIAHELGIARKTAEGHIARVKRKLNAKNSAHAVAIWLLNGDSPPQ
jgi:DNA-binding CsgD family transcriptional regulator